MIFSILQEIEQSSLGFVLKMFVVDANCFGVCLFSFSFGLTLLIHWICLVVVVVVGLSFLVSSFEDLSVFVVLVSVVSVVEKTTDDAVETRFAFVVDVAYQFASSVVPGADMVIEVVDLHTRSQKRWLLLEALWGLWF